MKANNIIIVPETHWDREWYLTFQEFRARLVLMMDKLLNILKTDPNYKNFTLDGQVIPLEDYLEVKPEKEGEIEKYIKEKRLSIGPMYVLPDEFLISGESLIRNLMIGHQIARKYGSVMKAGYIPDPFGHIAQLPQVLSGFEIPSCLFMRGFGNEFKENNLNMEFIWNAPGNAASILGIHLIASYGSVAELNLKRREGQYKMALKKINRVVSKLEQYTGTPYVLLNNGSDHHDAIPDLPNIIKQWNEQSDKFMEQNDFEYYINKVLESKQEFNSFQGELRGGKYSPLLSGVLSTRIWIKQRNTAIENLYEKYTEPLSSITWALDRSKKFEYPKTYILTGLKWLIKNHPHDSICGCSIDQVHNEMKTRFDWAEQIGNEVFKNSFIFLNDLIKFKVEHKDQNELFIYNPLPWQREDIVKFDIVGLGTSRTQITSFNLKILDNDGKEIEFQYYPLEERPRFNRKHDTRYRLSFLAKVPACGYKVYYVIPQEDEKIYNADSENFKLGDNSIENEFYKITINKKGKIDVYNKLNGFNYENICQIEDVGDWGDEYDYSGPEETQIDSKFTTKDANITEISHFLNGPTHKTIKINMNLKLPVSLSRNKDKREEVQVDNNIVIYISLYKGIDRIDFKIELENNSKDHRIRVLFPSNIKSTKVYADGQFYIVPRNVELPNSEGWVQKALPTNHQKDFVSVCDEKTCFAVLNKGLPEYEAIRENDGTITLAITLLRCVEWLSRVRFATRKTIAGPDIKTPDAQCLGKHEFEFSLIIKEKGLSFLNSEIHVKGKEFNNPLQPIFLSLIKQTPLRFSDIHILNNGLLTYFQQPYVKKVESYLPPELSFLEIDNKNIQLSALKKSEVGNSLIIRCYNLSSSAEKTTLKFYQGLMIKSATLVNLLEEKPINEIKANLDLLDENNIELSLKPHVIATIKIKFDLKSI
ncbi:MAG: hypothetical protein EU529_06460 [Promethearchaeota archaeon]|nr:MAG: hypothetical protein EU529_06460 [Candidatus Lokiarchaeota archaeon]